VEEVEDKERDESEKERVQGWPWQTARKTVAGKNSCSADQEYPRIRQVEGAQGEDDHAEGGGAGYEGDTWVARGVAEDQAAERQTDGDGEGGAEEDQQGLHKANP
jgi:hypothetical protein